MSISNKSIPPLLVIVGQTASGKSDLAIKIAKRMNGEIINADSWSVRKGLDVGTAKPSLDQQKSIKHHLIDIVEPNEDFNAARYKSIANKAINEIHINGKLPILVGGTGLYVDSVIYDYRFIKKGSSSKREELSLMSVEQLLEHALNLGLDISAIDTRNKRRIIRLIESGGEVPQKSKIRENTLIIGIDIAKEELRVRINKRVEEMINSGLESEVRDLAAQFNWEDEVMKGVGYRQWRGYFEGNQNIEETKKQIINATVNLAKRQRTWFKRNNSIHWLNQSVKLEEIVDFISTNLSI